MSIVRRRTGVRARRWTKDEYYRLGELGFFQGQRVELIDGRLVVQCPQGADHWSTVDRVREVLEGVFVAGYQVRMQGPIDLSQTTEPEPDVAVVVGVAGDFTQAHPTSAILIVEVSDTSLSFNRNRKASLYARAGIRDYWIVNLVDRQVEVYRDPVPDAAQHYGFRYATRADLVPPAVVQPLAVPGANVAVADLLG